MPAPHSKDPQFYKDRYREYTDAPPVAYEAGAYVTTMMAIIGPDAPKGAKIFVLTHELIVMQYCIDGQWIENAFIPDEVDPVELEEFREQLIPYVCSRVLEARHLAADHEVTKAALRLIN